ncbi:hypothetical protein B7P43_G05096 [Cryptotermes secundus]|uniref:Endonuclease/exonuclease/phosphatase domain-containing protein n=1 Tax=Cryptotermes secundus TaxID=105785 RepID=A0A2J7PXV1_9NEOP|nr:hypothetical protein B7P43_G05096 [Cryptotermes secundus]
MRVELVTDRISYKKLKGHWCDIIITNVHAPTEDKIHDIRGWFYEEVEHVFDNFLKYPMKILVGDFNAKVAREDIFKQKIRNESLHEISNDNGVREVNLATSENITVKSTMFLHCDIHKFTWTSPEAKIQNQIDHILIDRRRHSSKFDVQSFRAADRDTDQCPVVAKVRERPAVSKQTTHTIHMERFNLKILNEVEGWVLKKTGRHPQRDELPCESGTADKGDRQEDVRSSKNRVAQEKRRQEKLYQGEVLGKNLGIQRKSAESPRRKKGNKEHRRQTAAISEEKCANQGRQRMV